MVELNRIAEIIGAAAPLETQEGWDNSGWQICLDKSNGSDVNKILVTLELNEDVVAEAADSEVQLIVCHHPLIFGGIKSVDDKNVTGNMIVKLIQNGISVYVTHTPFDKCSGGNNDYLAGLLELSEIQMIPGDETGICRMGELKEAMAPSELAERYAERTGQDSRNYRLAGNLNQAVKQIGLCTGAGSEFFGLAAAAGCDLFVTGDVKYHEAQHARELGITLLDLGHFGSEQIFTENMASILRNALGDSVEIIESQVCLNPFKAV